MKSLRANFKPPFAQFVKKQHKPLQLVIEDAVDLICSQPLIGELKTGDLKEIRVYKFTHMRQQYLIAYRPPAEHDLKSKTAVIEILVIDFYQAGTHENFYTELKKYLKA